MPKAAIIIIINHLVIIIINQELYFAKYIELGLKLGFSVSFIIQSKNISCGCQFVLTCLKGKREMF